MTIEGWEFDVPSEDQPLKATTQGYKKFLNSAVWADMESWLQYRLEHLRFLLENAETLEDMRGYQYAIKQCKDTLNLPKRLKEETEGDKEEKEERHGN